MLLHHRAPPSIQLGVRLTAAARHIGESEVAMLDQMASGKAVNWLKDVGVGRGSSIYIPGHFP